MYVPFYPWKPLHLLSCPLPEMPSQSVQGSECRIISTPRCRDLKPQQHLYYPGICNLSQLSGNSSSLLHCQLGWLREGWGWNYPQEASLGISLCRMWCLQLGSFRAARFLTSQLSAPEACVSREQEPSRSRITFWRLRLRSHTHHLCPTPWVEAVTGPLARLKGREHRRPSPNFSV